MDPISILQNIFAIAQAIHNQLETVEANQAQCKRLSERIMIIIQALKNLEDIPRQEQFKQGLLFLQKILENCQKFIAKFTGKSWFKRVLKAGNYNQKFSSFTEDLRQAIEQLNLGLQAQQLCNKSEDKQDQEQDNRMIQARQDEMITLQREELRQVEEINIKQNEIQIEQNEHHQLVKDQLGSIRQRLKLLINQPGMELPKLLRLPYHEILFYEKREKHYFGESYLGQYKKYSVIVHKYCLEDHLKQPFRESLLELTNLKHSNLLALQGACIESNYECVVWEQVSTTLIERLRRKPLKPGQQLQIAEQIAQGLNYLHKEGYAYGSFAIDCIHLDKHQNVRLSHYGDKLTAKHKFFSFPLKEDSIWLAPEIRQGLPGSPASDSYSYGWVLWSIITHRLPEQSIKINEMEMLGHIPQEYQEHTNIIKACWENKPQNRPMMEEIITTLNRLALPSETKDVAPINNHPERLVPLEVQPQLAEVKQQPPLQPLSPQSPQQPSPRTLCAEGLEYEQKKDFAQASRCYELAASSGNSRAMASLGFFLLTGKAGRTDKEKAKKLLEQAAERGECRAQYNLARMLEKGDGCKQDLNQALFWYNKAAEQADEEAKVKVEKLLLLKLKNKD